MDRFVPDRVPLTGDGIPDGDRSFIPQHFDECIAGIVSHDEHRAVARCEDHETDAGAHAGCRGVSRAFRQFALARVRAGNLTRAIPTEKYRLGPAHFIAQSVATVGSGARLSI